MPNGKLAPETDINVILATERTALANERTSLSKERTFLSWLRTGLAFVGGGLAVIRLLNFQTSEHQFISILVGKIMILWGIVIFVLAQIDNYRVLKNVRDTGYLNSITTTTALTFTLVVLSLLLLTTT